MNDLSPLHDRIASRRGAASDDEGDAFDDCGAFGFLRGPKDRSLMIEFRFLDGTSEALSYATLERVSYDPADGLTLRFLGVRVRVSGRNLAVAQSTGVSVLEAIHRHRIPWVREVEELRGRFYPADAAVVTRIEILDGTS